MSRLNPVFTELQPSSTLYINETVNRLWQQGEQVFHMGFGESRFDVHPKLQQALALHADKKSYLPARGLPELLEQVANYYAAKLSLQVAPSQVIVGPGSKALIFALQMILDADLFLPSPSWVSYAPQAKLLGNRHFYIPSSVADHYQLDIDALDNLVRTSDNPNKLLVLNSPNNPTGEVLDKELLKRLADYCQANNILVISDEIYFQLDFDADCHVSIARYYPQGTFVLGGLSKHLSLGGWRVGVAILPDTEWGANLMEKMVVYASETWSSVSAPIQYAVIAGYSLDTELEAYVADCRQIHAIRTRYIRGRLLDAGISCSGGKGAFYVAANFDRFAAQLGRLGVHTSGELSRYLLEQYRIACLPGSDFGLPEHVLTLRLSTSYLDMEGADDPSRIFQLYQSGNRSEALMSEANHPVTHAAMNAFEQLVSDLSESDH